MQVFAISGAIYRAGVTAEECTTSAPKRFTFLPCAACTEISAAQTYEEWLWTEKDSPALLCPHAAVTFESGELPAAYVRKSGKWCLAQGVGPKELDVRTPHRLPAGQFRELLPPTAQAVQ